MAPAATDVTSTLYFVARISGLAMLDSNGEAFETWAAMASNKTLDSNSPAIHDYESRGAHTAPWMAGEGGWAWMGRGSRQLGSQPTPYSIHAAAAGTDRRPDAPLRRSAPPPSFAQLVPGRRRCRCAAAAAPLRPVAQAVPQRGRCHIGNLELVSESSTRLMWAVI